MPRSSVGLPIPEAARPTAPLSTLQRLLKLARSQPNHRICVCGSKDRDTLSELQTLGYDEVCRASCGARADARCDLLLFTGTFGPASFADGVAQGLPHLRDGGVLAASESGLQDDALIAQVLAACGRVAGWRVHDMAGGCLVALQVVYAGADELQRAA